ncbi:MAG: EAL domain-containing protein [Magnetococcales bacterium]|nr:EAL domain-containing protein [Magnetococcales bacterium]
MHIIPQVRFWRYLVAILLPTLLIIPSVGAVLTQQGSAIDFIRNELRGLADIQQLNGMVTLLQQMRGLNQMALQQGASGSGGGAEPTGSLRALEASLADALALMRRDLAGDPFQMAADLQRLEGWLGGIVHPVAAFQSAQTVFEKQTHLINRVVDLRRKVLIRSHLVLDEDLQSTFLINLVGTGLPELEETIARVRGLGSGLLTQSVLSDVDRLRFEERLGDVRSHWEEVRHDQHTILAYVPPLQDLFACFQDRLHPTVQNFLDVSASLLRRTTHGETMARYFSLGTQAIQVSQACTDGVRTELLRILTERLENTTRNRDLVWVGTLLVWLWGSHFVISSYRLNRRAFEQVQESEHKTQAIVESAVDGILTIDANGIIHSANAAVEHMFGYQSGELIDRPVGLLMPAPHRQAHDGYLRAYLTSGVGRVIGHTREVEGVGKNGEHFPLEIAVGTFHSGGQVFFTGILHDITERKTAKEALQAAYDELEQRVLERTQELQGANRQLIDSLERQKQAESGLRLAAKVFAHASEAIVITQVDGVIVDVNQAYSQITGFQREEVLGANPRIGKSGRHGPEFYQEMWAAITTQGQWSGEVWDRRKNGDVYPKWLTINAVKDGTGQTTHFVGIFSDISHIKMTEERLEQLAFYDPLTRLPNRMLFKDRAGRAIEWANRHRTRGAIFFIDLDRFKQVNDTQGHAAGDRLLVEVAKRLLVCVRASDTVARLGGDEFTVILTDLQHGDEAATVAQKIIAAIANPVELDGHQANIGASVGIAIFPDDGNNYDLITRNADVAMYHAKESGRGTYRFFEPGMNAQSAKRAMLETHFHAGLQNKEFLLHYQPKVDVLSGHIVGMEALVRWRQANGVLVPPLDFIPFAEETGLIVPLGQEILRMACVYNKGLLDASQASLRVAVNLSGRQFQDKDLHTSIQTILDETGLPAEFLELEVTESMMMQDERQAIAILKRLREMGLSLAMDDFGTGYSSLSYLKKFPLNSLKIDQSFVRDLIVGSDDAAIVSAIVSLAKSLRLRVVAEGVENQRQRDFLQSIGCDELQGYWISRPLEATVFTRFVADWI